MPALSRRAQKDLAALPEPLRQKAQAIIDRLDREPALGKKLLGALTGLRSARLGRSHRILYRVLDDGTFVVTIADRKDAYQ